MGVISRENEITLKSLPPKIFKALFVDWDTLILKVRPSLVQKVRIVDGNGEAGTVKVLDFGEELRNKHVTLKIDDNDSHHFTYGCTVYEGNTINEMIDKISYKVKIVASLNEGSIYKDKITYYTVGDYPFSEEVIAFGREKINEIVKAVDNYILENPN